MPGNFKAKIYARVGIGYGIGGFMLVFAGLYGISRLTLGQSVASLGRCGGWPARKRGRPFPWPAAGQSPRGPALTRLVGPAVLVCRVCLAGFAVARALR